MEGMKSDREGGETENQAQLLKFLPKCTRQTSIVNKLQRKDLVTSIITVVHTGQTMTKLTKAAKPVRKEKDNPVVVQAAQNQFP